MYDDRECVCKLNVDKAFGTTPVAAAAIAAATDSKAAINNSLIKINNER